MPVAFSDPFWLWLLLPAIALVVAGWAMASRTLTRGRRLVSLAIRMLLVVALVASLAGARIALPSDRLSVIFLVDASDSMVGATREEMITFARDAVREMPVGDSAGVVVFGANALVDRLPSEIGELPPPSSAPVVGSTDIAAAVRLASAIFPAGAQRRLVLLSDGNDTTGQAQQAILAAAERGIRLDVLVPDGGNYPEALVDGIDAPSGARVGETVELTVRVRSTVETRATLRLLADGATVATRELELEPGSLSLPFRLNVDEPGFHVFRAVLEPEEDHFAENNVADTYLLVSGEPQVLLATDDPTRAGDLVTALEDSLQRVTVVDSRGVPSSLATLARYDAVVLDNVSASALGEAAMASLQIFVRDLGRGLVMLGGRESYGAGGYLNSPIEEAMPVYMTVRDRERTPEVALVAVVDRSGSMADCHCTGDSRDNSMPSTRGFEKVDIAKEAIIRAAEALSPSDQLGVVTFAENASWAIRTGPIDAGALHASLGFRADGGTNIYAGLKAAYDDLVRNPAKLRHIILITDGWSESGAYDQLLADMQEAGITLSTIGTGGGSADILSRLAEQSGGRYYDAADATTIPDIFLRETIRTAGEQIVEEAFRPIPSAPSDILRGLDAGRLPGLIGYNATTPKGTSTVALLTHRDDPLLAQWQYGLGRSVAWTSDARQQWAGEWIGGPEFGTLVTQLVTWTLPPQDEQGIEVRFSAGRAGELNVEVISHEDDGSPRNFYRTVLRLVGPQLDPLQAALVQVGPGRYAGSIRADEPGAYLVRVAQTREGAAAASRTLGVVSPASEEYRRLGIDRDALRAYATDGQGRELDPEEPGAVWTHDIEEAAFPTPIWPWLLLFAMLLIPIDIGLRRVALARSDLARARGWIRGRMGLGGGVPEAVPGLAELRAARARSERRTQRQLQKPPAASVSVQTPGAAPVPDEGAPAEPRGMEPAGAAPNETLATRLARRRREGG